MKQLFFILLFSSVRLLQAQEARTNIYSGGMLIFQPGYVIAENPQSDIQNNSNAIGGILRFYFLKHCTAGIYGGNIKSGYATKGSDNSFLSLGYGGIFAGASILKGGFRYTFSVFAGMGTKRNLHISQQNQNLITQAYFYKTSSMLWSPLLSLDIIISKRFSLTTQASCLVEKYTQNNYLVNPAIQFGVLISR